MTENKSLSMVNACYSAKADGYYFNLYDDVWVLDKNNKPNLAVIKSYLSEDVLDGCIRTLGYYASNMSGAHTSNIISCLQHMLRTMDASVITETVIINYRALPDLRTEWYLSIIRGFLRRWHQLGYHGVSDEVIELLNGWRLKGNRKGDAVKRKDPTQGPLTDNELQGFNEGAVRAFELGLISLEDLTISLLASNTGRRPQQLSHLRVIDVLCGENTKGDPMYLLRIPRGKQEKGFRAAFKPFSTSQELWAVVNAQAKSAIGQVQKALGFELQEMDRNQVPLFPDLKAVATVASPSELREQLMTDKLHIPSAKITHALQRVVDASDVRSERTGEMLALSARRFRYTTGTRAAREGFGELVIAELLDHSDTQNAGVYIKNIPEHVQRLDEAVGFQMARYAQAFAGVLVDSEENAERGEDPNSRIRTTDGQAMGTCGEHGFCGANVPIPCYTCMHFQPWLDGPHDEVFRFLISERERTKEITGDIEVAAVLDRSIAAVAEVIERCQRRHDELVNQDRGEFNG